MLPLSFRCPDTGHCATSGLLVDRASVSALRDLEIVVPCSCTRQHRISFGDLFESMTADDMPPFDSPRLRRGSISG